MLRFGENLLMPCKFFTVDFTQTRNHKFVTTNRFHVFIVVLVVFVVGASESDDIVIGDRIFRFSSNFNVLYNFNIFRNLSFSIWDTCASRLIRIFNRCLDCPDFSIDVLHFGQTSRMGGVFDL